MGRRRRRKAATTSSMTLRMIFISRLTNRRDRKTSMARMWAARATRPRLRNRRGKLPFRISIIFRIITSVILLLRILTLRGRSIREALPLILAAEAGAKIEVLLLPLARCLVAAIHLAIVVE